MMMKSATTFFFVVAMALFGACANDNDSQTTATSANKTSVAAHDMTPEQLGELGAKIQKEPDQADKYLSEHGLTRDTFEAAIRKVTEDPDASKRYAEAFRKSGGSSAS